MSIKLPKQFLYWAKKSGIKKHPYWARANKGYYLVGRGRRWRVNNLGEFQCSCPIGEFYRWACCVAYTYPNVPKSEAEFIKAVKMMREKAATAYPSWNE